MSAATVESGVEDVPFLRHPSGVAHFRFNVMGVCSAGYVNGHVSSLKHSVGNRKDLAVSYLERVVKAMNCMAIASK